jgi:hypothetical protein
MAPSDWLVISTSSELSKQREISAKQQKTFGLNEERIEEMVGLFDGR